MLHKIVINMAHITKEDIIREVRQTFTVTYMTSDPDYLEFVIQPPATDFKTKFANLAQRLEEDDIVCQIQDGKVKGGKEENKKLEQKRKEEDYEKYGYNGGVDDITGVSSSPFTSSKYPTPPPITLTVRRIEFKKQGRIRSSSWIPRILFGTVIAFVMIDGYYRTVNTNTIIPIGDPIIMAVIYTTALLGILGIHELGHLVASRIHKIKTTWPYFIPGLPIIGIPTFGALIMAKGLMINREKTFDVAIAGPIAGLAIVMIVTVYGAYTVPIIDPELSAQLHESKQLAEWQFGEPLLMTGVLELFGKGGEDTEILLTPILFAAWIGFFLTFANLMPAGQLDGGHMLRTVFGKKMLRVCTYASAGILFVMNFWFVAMFVLLMSGRNAGISIMDDTTPLTRNRKISYVIVMGLAVLCAPIPNEFTLIEPLLRLI